MLFLEGPGDDFTGLGVGGADLVGLAFELGQLGDVVIVPGFSLIARQHVRQRAALLKLQALEGRLEWVFGVHVPDSNEWLIQHCDGPVSTRTTSCSSCVGSGASLWLVVPLTNHAATVAETADERVFRCAYDSSTPAGSSVRCYSVCSLDGRPRKPRRIHDGHAWEGV